MLCQTVTGLKHNMKQNKALQNKYYETWHASTEGTLRCDATATYSVNSFSDNGSNISVAHV